jgi:hypothetical protein
MVPQQIPISPTGFAALSPLPSLPDAVWQRRSSDFPSSTDQIAAICG